MTPKPVQDRPNKFKNKKVYRTPAGEIVCGGAPPGSVKLADSMKEYRRRLLLLEWQRAGLISNLRFQVSFRLHAAGGEVVARYWSDFVYIQGGRLVVEDVKSVMTKTNTVYRLKKKWMKAEHGITISEV